MQVSHVRWRWTVGAAVATAVLVPATAAAGVSPVPLPVPAVQTLAPGITYQRTTIAGGEVIHVLRVAPGGLASLQPVFVAGAVNARGDLARTTRALAPQGAVASVNGDFFNFAQAYPSGLTITADQGLASTPNPLRSALVISPSGLLSLARARMAATWTPLAADGSAMGSPGTIAGINQPAVYPREVMLFTAAYGRAIPPLPARLPAGTSGPTPTTEDSATIVPDVPGLLEPNQVRTGTVIANSAARGVQIPVGDLVLTGVGPAAAAIAARLPVGARVALRVPVTGIAPGVQVLGGGPAIVVGGRAIHGAGEGFVPGQLVPRSQRTAIGQTASGVDLLVTAEGPGQGSPGLTVPQQADLMVRLGARTAIAMDSGGSSEMIVNGAGVMPWRSPRPISTAAVVRYGGVRVGRLVAPVSPNGDGVQDAANVGVTVPSPGTVTLTLGASHRPPRTFFDRVVPAVPMAVGIDPQRLGLADGSYRLTATLTTMAGVVSRDTRVVVVDRTLGHLAARRLTRGGAPLEQISFRLERAATVTVRVTTRAGRLVAVPLRARRLGAGPHAVVWNQRRGSTLVSGGVLVTVTASTVFGAHGLIEPIALARPWRGRR